MFLDKISENIVQFRGYVIFGILLFLVVATSFFSGEWNQWLLSIFLILTFPLIFFSLLLVLSLDFKKILNKTIFFSPHFYLSIFLVISLVGSLVSSYRYDSLNQFSLLLSYIIIFWVTTFLVKEFAKIKILVLTIFFTGLLVSIVNIVLFATDPFARAAGLLLNANALGSYFLFSVPLGLVLFLESQTKKQRVIYGVATFLVIVSFLLTFSYTGWLSFFIPLILMIVIYHRKIFTRKSILGVLGLILLILIIGVSFRYLKTKDFTESLKLYQVIPFEGAKFSFNQRLQFNLAALKIFQDNSLIGTGLSSYQSVYPQYAQTLFEQPRYVHNYYLQTLAELGIFGFLNLAAFIILLLWKVYKIIKVNFSDLEKKPYVLGLGLGVLGSAIHALFDFGWQFPAVFLLFWISSGIILSAGRISGGQTKYVSEQRKNYFSLIFKIAIFLVGVVLLLRGFTLFIANYYFQQAEIFIKDGETEQAVIQYKNGLKYDPHPEHYRNFAWQEFILAHQDKDYSEAIEYINKSLKWNKKDYFAYRILGRAYFAQKIYDKAEENYLKAIFYDPVFHPDFHLDLAILYKEQKKVDQAIDVLENILKKYKGITNSTNIYLPKQLADINYFLGNIYLEKGDNAQARFYFEKALERKSDFEPGKKALEELQTID